jgi:acyl-CoA thioester hydrolase
MLSHRHTLRPIYGDTDMMGVVYYANYFRFFEAGRTEFLRAQGFEYKDFEKSGFALPVVSASAKYHAPARYDEELSLETTLSEVRFSTVRMTYRLVRVVDESLIATGETRHACIGPDGRVVRLPQAFLKLMEARDGS